MITLCVMWITYNTRGLPWLQEIQQELPELGTLLPVVLYKISTTGSRQFTLPAAGSWAKLRNVGATLLQGQLMVRDCTLTEFDAFERPGWPSELCEGSVAGPACDELP